MIRDLRLASTKYENELRSSSGKRPPTSRQDSSRIFNERYPYDTSDVESGMQRMKIRDDGARYDRGQGPSRPAAISRHDQEHSRLRHIPDDDLSSNWHLVDKPTEPEKATSFVLSAKLQISGNEQSQPVKAFLDTQAEISCISEEFMESLPGVEKAQIQPARLQPYTVDNRPIDVIGCSTIYIAWEGTDFKKLLVYIFSNLWGVDLLLSGDFIQKNGLLIAGPRSIEYVSRDLEPGAQAAVRQVSVRGPKLRRLQQGPGIDPQKAPSAKPPQTKPPQTDPPSQPSTRGTPGMRRPG
jgi:hypothetical protein